MRAALELRACGSRGQRSNAEQRVHDYILQFPVEQPQWNVDVTAFDETFEIDFVFTASRICLEVDGPTHDAGDVQVRDRRQDTLLRADGWLPFRVDVREFDHDPASACEAVLAAVLAHRPT